MADTIVVFVLTRHWDLGASYDCPRQVPGAWSHHPHWRCGICCRSVAFDYPAANMSRNSAVFRREDSHSPSCPGMGGTALMLLRWPSSREAMKLTKLRNVLRCLLHPYDAVFRLQPAVHKLAVVEFRAPYMGIAVSFRKSLPGGSLIVEDVLCHVSLIIHDCYLEEIHSCVVLVV